MGSADNFCLRWSEFEQNISASFRELREESEFFDVTLCCDNGEDTVQAHKVILAACSPLFRKILAKQNGQLNPLLYLKGIRIQELKAVLNFMYHGRVAIAQDALNSFLAVAEELEIKGLTASDNAVKTPKIGTNKSLKRRKPGPRRRDNMSKRVKNSSSLSDDPDPDWTPKFTALGGAGGAGKNVGIIKAENVDNNDSSSDLVSSTPARTMMAPTVIGDGFEDLVGQYDVDEEYDGDDGETRPGQDQIENYISPKDPEGFYWCKSCNFKAERKSQMIKHVETKHYSTRTLADGSRKMLE